MNTCTLCTLTLGHLNIRLLHERLLESTTFFCVNYRYLTSPEKRARLESTKKETKALRMCVMRLEKKISDALEKNSVVLDSEISMDMSSIMDKEDSVIKNMYKEGTFQYIFWNQQKEAIGKEGAKKNGIRWHPLIIKWCLYLCHQSSKAYDTFERFWMHSFTLTTYFTRLLACCENRGWFFCRC